MGDTTKGRRFHGGCHCGNIRFWFDWPAQAENIPVRACGCSFCTKHGAVWTSHPEGQFQLQITDAFQAKRYQFGQKTADMHLKFVVPGHLRVAQFGACVNFDPADQFSG